MFNKSTLAILAATLLGILAGAYLHQHYIDLAALATDDASKAAAADAKKAGLDNLQLLADIFLRMIRMIIGPLVFATLVSGIAHLGGGSSVGRIAGKSMLWFVCASLVSLTLGLIMVNVLQPGAPLAAMNDLVKDAQNSTGVKDLADKATVMTLRNFVEHLIPTSIADSVAKNEVLQIVFFSVLFGIGLGAIGEKGHFLVQGIEILAQTMLRVTGYVMYFAPLGVFGAMAKIITDKGLGVLGSLATFMGEFYLTMGMLWLLMILVGLLILGPRVGRLISLMTQPLATAFTTASSEAAFPKVLAGLEQFGVSNRIASFVLPLGYSFNLDGSMLYCTFASLFIAQATGTVPPIASQIAMLALFFITSKGIAGVPRASLVVIMAGLPTFGIAATGIGLLLGVDAFLDMGRSATNVVGNSLASAVVAKWEGELGEPLRDEDEVGAVIAAG